MSLKPWREIAVPHADVLKGTFQQAEFAADISRVHEGTATEEYQNAKLFFQRTFITEGMRLLLDSVVKRLSGQGGDPVIQLQTAFGGGKTHTILAVYHLAKGETPASALPGISPILDAANITELPRARVAVLDGIKLAPNQPMQVDGQLIHTLWGYLAWQLGQAEGYALVADADTSGTSPGKAVLETLLRNHAPCVILIDELVRYIGQFEDGKTLTGGTFDSNLSFIQALTEAIKGVPNAVLLASLPDSEKEAGGPQGVKALNTLAHYFGRVQAVWKPVEAEESFEIVRRRLFSTVHDEAAAEAVCRTFATYYTDNGDSFPQETQESRYFQRLKSAYPIHPEVFDRLYEDWSSLDRFQRTRGVLKLMASVIHQLWKNNDKELLIMPGSLPLANADTRTVILTPLPQGWDPVITRDIDGDRSETAFIESSDPRLGSVLACRRTARTIFLGSAPTTTAQKVRGVDEKHVLLGAAQPGQSVSIYKDALRRLADRLHYLNTDNERYWFDTRPNLRREMEDRKQNFHEQEHIVPEIERLLKRLLKTTPNIPYIHIFTGSHDLPDDHHFRLVVLPPAASFSRSGANFAYDHAQKILKTRGDQPRFNQNRLIFLAAEYTNVSRLQDQIRSVLAWESILGDLKNMRLNLDVHQSQQAQQNLDTARATLNRVVTETYKWILAPIQLHQPHKNTFEFQWESYPLHVSNASPVHAIEQVLTDNELIITRWAPIHLHAELKKWFWDDDAPEVSALAVWKQFCQQLYLPRLLNQDVFQQAIAYGTQDRSFFAIAQGKTGDQYQGFIFGEPSFPVIDDSLLLIDPACAAEYKARSEEIIIGPPDQNDSTFPPPPLPGNSDTPGGKTSGGTSFRPAPRIFNAQIELDPLTGIVEFSKIDQEVIQHFTNHPDIKIRIMVDIIAESNADHGFSDTLQRTVKENCTTLKFDQADFNS